MRRTAFILASLALAGTVAADAQNAPRRPRLGSDADTNDVRAYFQLGLERLERNPEQAAAAFYWATRLDPNAPQAQYARQIAELMRNANRLVQYRLRNPRTLRERSILAIDSLRFRAEMLDPFFHRGMDEVLLMMYAQHSVPRDEWNLRSDDAGRAGQIANVERFFETADPYSRGQLYYGRGRLRDALQYWDIALRTLPIDWVWTERARAWAELRQLDSARVSLERALDLWRSGRGTEVNRHVFETRAAWEYALGRVHEDQRNATAAREAYERAIGEDRHYYQAYLRLGVLALAQRDTATARFNIALATQREDVQFATLAAAATIYSQIGDRDSAVALLRRATDREPFAASGWLMLARAHEGTTDPQLAAAYERFIALAPRDDRDLAGARQRLAELRAPRP